MIKLVLLTATLLSVTFATQTPVVMQTNPTLSWPIAQTIREDSSGIAIMYQLKSDNDPTFVECTEILRTDFTIVLRGCSAHNIVLTLSKLSRINLLSDNSLVGEK